MHDCTKQLLMAIFFESGSHLQISQRMRASSIVNDFITSLIFCQCHECFYLKETDANIQSLGALRERAHDFPLSCGCP